MSTTQIEFRVGIIKMIKSWIKNYEVNNQKIALLLSCIPASCPFERQINVWGYTVKIPSLCRLNPFYESLIILRFRALTFLNETSR